MERDELIGRLDKTFSVRDFDERNLQLSSLPLGYGEMLREYARRDFIEGPWNGLMLDNTDWIERVYLVVFPTESLLDTAIAREVERGAPGAMIFSHHLTDEDESKYLPIPIPEAQLKELREHRISLYICHAPLDCRPRMSPADALADALNLRDRERFGFHINGLAGIHGVISPTAFGQFAVKVAEACELPSLRYEQVRHNGHVARHVAIVPGDVDVAEFMREAQALGCDTCVTGTWWPYAPGDEADHARRKMRRLLPEITMNLIGTSQYGIELPAMRDKALAWFRDLGLETQLLRQLSPW